MRAVAALLLTCLWATAAYGGEGQGLGPGRQQWDFLEVREGAHVFYWLYYTLANVTAPEERPLIVWLQNGPDRSPTAYGNFEELGVLDMELNERNLTWVKEVNVLFVDIPVGAGFSYVEELNLLAKNKEEDAADLMTFTKLFLERNPSFVATPLYIFCKHYGCQIAATAALMLQKAVKAGDFNVNLTGLAMGNPWTSPIDSVMAWAPYLLETGFVDYEGYKRIRAPAEEAREAVEAGEWTVAMEKWLSSWKVILPLTGYADLYNIMNVVSVKDALKRQSSDLGLNMYHPDVRISELLDELMNGRVKEALDLPAERVWGAQGFEVWKKHLDVFMKPATDMVERLLNETKVDVVVYNGNLDLVVATHGSLEWVQRLQWPGAVDWRAAKRHPLDVDGYVEGFVKNHSAFTFYWVLRAGMKAYPLGARVPGAFPPVPREGRLRPPTLLGRGTRRDALPRDIAAPSATRPFLCHPLSRFTCACTRGSGLTSAESARRDSKQ